MRILIADDELMSRRLLEKTMQRAGYEVTAVANGQIAAAELCKPDGPRLALLDWIMPELDGPGVCEVRGAKTSLTFDPADLEGEKGRCCGGVRVRSGRLFDEAV